MARGNSYRCRVCGRTYDYCPSCALVVDPVLDSNFCSHQCYSVFTILSAHGCHLATTEETIKALDEFNITEGNFTPEIEAHIDSLFEAEETK